MAYAAEAVFSNVTENQTAAEAFQECMNSTNKDACSVYDFEEQRPFIPSLFVQLVWTILFSVMVFFAVLGNLAMISIILTKRVLRTKINIYLLNLAIADFMMATLNAMFNFISMLKSHWPFGYVWCKVNNFVANLCIAASVFTILVTTLDRYYAIVYPLKSSLRPKKKNQIFVVILIWFTSSLISCPLLVYSTTVTFNFVSNDSRTLCLILYPDGFYSFLSKYDLIPFDTQNSLVQHLYLFFYLLAMSSCCLNVLIYFLMNKRFRTILTEFLCCFQKSQSISRYTSRADRTNYNGTNNTGF